MAGRIVQDTHKNVNLSFLHCNCMVEFRKENFSVQKRDYFRMQQSLETVQSGRKKPEKMRKEKRVRLTQKAIVTAAATLFAERGFGSTSLDDIADVLGVTKGALYYHVKNKEEILRLIYLSVLNVAEEPLRRIVESDLPASREATQSYRASHRAFG